MSEPKPAIVCIVRRDDGAVLLARRNPALRFMGGIMFFLGGGLMRRRAWLELRGRQGLRRRFSWLSMR